jgi:hypothetical protein
MPSGCVIAPMTVVAGHPISASVANATCDLAVVEEGFGLFAAEDITLRIFPFNVDGSVGCRHIALEASRHPERKILQRAIWLLSLR